MSVQVRARREAATFLSSFVGAQGELLVDTTNNRVQVHDGVTPGGSPAAKLGEVITNTRASVADASYTALAADRSIAVTSLTAARTITLPAAAAYPTGTQLLVFDESGACSAANVINIARSGTDTINGAASASISTAYGYLAFESNGAGKWTVVDQTASASAATRTSVSDANYVALTSDRVIGYTSLTAARTVTLPSAGGFPVGTRLLILDESGSASATNTITLARAGSDTINGTTSAAISAAYGYIAVQSNGASKWTITDQPGSAATLSSASVVLPGYLFGLTLANNGATSLDIAAGTATMDDNATRGTLAATMTKTLGAWTAGSGNGGLDTGTAAANTWYHVFLVTNPTTSATDVLLSTSVSSPTFPAGYTKKRRIGSVLTTATATNFTSFTQTGDVFIWQSARQSLNGITPPTSDTLFTVASPPGVKTQARLRMQFNTASGNSINIRSPDEAFLAGGGNNTFVTSVNVAATTDLLTNTSSQLILWASSASGSLYLVTWGWVDTRGR